jgi:hypothetical protein
MKDSFAGPELQAEMDATTNSCSRSWLRRRACAAAASHLAVLFREKVKALAAAPTTGRRQPF